MPNLKSRLAGALEAKRRDLINQPLARIWDDLAAVAIDVVRDEVEGEAYFQGQTDAMDAEQYSECD